MQLQRMSRLTEENSRLNLENAQLKAKVHELEQQVLALTTRTGIASPLPPPYTATVYATPQTPQPADTSPAPSHYAVGSFTAHVTSPAVAPIAQHASVRSATQSAPPPYGASSTASLPPVQFFATHVTSSAAPSAPQELTLSQESAGSNSLVDLVTTDGFHNYSNWEDIHVEQLM